MHHLMCGHKSFIPMTKDEIISAFIAHCESELLISNNGRKDSFYFAVGGAMRSGAETFVEDLQFEIQLEPTKSKTLYEQQSGRAIRTDVQPERVLDFNKLFPSNKERQYDIYLITNHSKTPSVRRFGEMFSQRVKEISNWLHTKIDDEDVQMIDWDDVHCIFGEILKKTIYDTSFHPITLESFYDEDKQIQVAYLVGLMMKYVQSDDKMIGSSEKFYNACNLFIKSIGYSDFEHLQLPSLNLLYRVAKI